MKITELMIGDLILINNTPHRIEAIDGIDAEILADDNIYYVGEDRYRSEDKIEGIPITPEILVKNGWYYGLTSDEEDAEQRLGGCHYIRHWCYDEGEGSISLIFPNDTDGGELIIDDQSFNLNLVFCDTLHVHELQDALRLCGLNELVDNFKV